MGDIMETTEQILERQHTTLNFKDGKVEYFSISTQWEVVDTIDDAIKHILEADQKYNGKAPYFQCLKAITFPDDIVNLMKEFEMAMKNI